MTETKYDFHYHDASVYAHAMALVAEHGKPGGVVVDLGAGFGAIAEPCRAAGFGYAGVDVADTGLESLRGRGFPTATCDLNSPDDAARVVEAMLDGRPLAAITMLDTIEHLTNGPATLSALSTLAARLGGAPLVVSIPNVTHIDLATKLLLGRWDVTETGLLDRTHVAFYTPYSIVGMPAAAGWRQVGENDFVLTKSDQHFPDDLVVQSDTTPIGELLLRVREGAAPATFVNQFVRAYVPAEPVVAGDEVRDQPFASVLIRTQGRRTDRLHDALLSLAAQTSEDFEVLLLCHDAPEAAVAEIESVVASMPPEFGARVRLVPVAGGLRGRPLNVGLAEARGRYVVILDDDDVVLAHWIEEFQRTAAEAPGSIVRAVVARQDFEVETESRGYSTVGPPSCPYPDSFDLIGHLVDNWSPLCGFAFPHGAFAEFGVAFDEDLPVLEDWDVVTKLAPLCGVASTPVPTSVYRRWLTGYHSLVVHSDAEWDAARKVIRDRLDSQPVLLPPGATKRVRELLFSHDYQLQRADRLQSEVDVLRHELAQIDLRYRLSTSWKVSAPVRWAGKAARRVRARRAR